MTGSSRGRQSAGIKIPEVSGAQMAEVDRRALEAGLTLDRMMENAGRHLADRVGARGPGKVAVVVGGGHNGGGGLAAARHLRNRGMDVAVVSAGGSVAEETARQMRLLVDDGVEWRNDMGVVDVVVDALVGYSLVGPLRGRARDLAREMSAGSGFVISLDLPSGTASDLRQPTGVRVRADETVTLALPKRGLRARPDDVGQLWLADIGIPRVVYERAGLDVPLLFASGPLVSLQADESGWRGPHE